MAENDSTTKAPERWEWLGDLLSRTLWPLDGYLKTLDEHDIHQDVLAVLIPLAQQMKADLDVIDEVLAQSFGGYLKVELTQCLEAWKALDRDSLKRAYADPDHPRTAAQGGE